MPISDDLPVALAHLGMLRHNPESTIRPVLLRVVVDLFLQKQHHAPEDLKTFEAMVGPLLDDVDDTTRQILLERLFDHPATPAPLLRRLMNVESLIAAEVYRHATFEEGGLLRVAQSGPAMTAATVAQRVDLSAAVVAALVARSEPRIALALADNAAITFTPSQLDTLVRRASRDRGLAGKLAARSLDPLALAPLFPVLSPQQRRLMLDEVRRDDLGRREWGRPEGQAVATLVRLDRLVLGGEWDAFDDMLCTALAMDGRVLRPLLHDGSGDILALALAAVGASPEMAARAFSSGEPSIGRSVPTVRRLTAIVAQVAPAAARRLLEAMLGFQPAEPRRAAAATLQTGVRRADGVSSESAVANPRRTAEMPRRARG